MTLKLTADGLLLTCVFPGVDPIGDIVQPSAARILLPPGGAAAVEVLSGPVLTGGPALDAALAATLGQGGGS